MEFDIVLNGAHKRVELEQEVKDRAKLLPILSRLGYKDRGIAVAVNGEFVPKSSYDKTNIRNGDHLEVLAPMQGG